MKGTLILISGLPGSGKTTLAKRLEQERGALRFCPDDWIEAILGGANDTSERDRLRDPIENLQWDIALSYLEKGLTVILENGFWAEEERTLYAIGALEKGAAIELLYLDAPDFEALLARIERRNRTCSPLWIMNRSDLEVGWGICTPPDQKELDFYDHGEIIAWKESASAS